MNDFIRLGLLKNIEEIDRNKNYSKYERYFGHCQFLSELHYNFTYLFCHHFVKHLVC